MAGKTKKFPEIAMIIAMTESGLIGKGDGMPWKSSLDFEWFKKNTVGWPTLFGRNTAQAMPTFPLKNRPCAIISRKMDAPFAIGNNGYAKTDVFPGIEQACRSFQNFDKIFIAGGASIYRQALQMQKPWLEMVGTPDIGQPLVGAIIRTVFPDGFVNGDKYLDETTLELMGEKHFNLMGHYKYALADESYDRVEYCNGYFNKESCFPAMNGIYGAKQGDTPFPWIRFEVWNRCK